ncbi:MAG TPA: hypothetical protein VN903_29475 [Polyangia bacterium]|nr:hypothetical protein [Polyangia bacterium]
MNTPPRTSLFVTLGLAAVALGSLPSRTAAAAACGTENLLTGKKPSASQAIKGDLGLVTDGNVAPEGADWNSPVGVVMENANSSVTYDLGETRDVSAVVVQADANDTYKVMGSVDGSPASYKLLVELANVVSTTGHGLRTRANQFALTPVRFIRIGDANGDAYFSLSEFQAFCKAPTPFPPSMKIVEAPPAANPDSQATPKPGSDTGRWALLLTAVALALAWLAYKTITRPSSDAAKDDAAKAAGEKPASTPPGENPPSDKPSA